MPQGNKYATILKKSIAFCALRNKSILLIILPINRFFFHIAYKYYYKKTTYLQIILIISTKCELDIGKCGFKNRVCGLFTITFTQC